MGVIECFHMSKLTTNGAVSDRFETHFGVRWTRRWRPLERSHDAGEMKLGWT